MQPREDSVAPGRENSGPQGRESSGPHRTVGEIGPYALTSVLGEGATAIVYVAQHRKLGRRCAIKRLRPELLGDPQAAQRFLDEARALASIQHPNLVTIYDVVESDEGPYLVTEFLDGRDLSIPLRRGSIEVARALRIAAEICAALVPVHAIGIVHRDLKPANVFLDVAPDGRERLKLLDFGAARMRKAGDASEEGTEDAVLALEDDVGPATPLYMSPEQATGTPLDARADVYSLGVMLYEMIVGGPPFNASQLGDLMIQHAVHPPPTFAERKCDAPPAVEALVMRCLAKAPDDRFPSAAALLAEIRRVAADLDVDLETGRRNAPPPVEHGARWTWVFAALGASFVGLVGLVYLLYQRQIEVAQPPAVVAPAPVASPLPSPSTSTPTSTPSPTSTSTSTSAPTSQVKPGKRVLSKKRRAGAKRVIRRKPVAKPGSRPEKDIGAADQIDPFGR